MDYEKKYNEMKHRVYEIGAGIVFGIAALITILLLLASRKPIILLGIVLIGATIICYFSMLDSYNEDHDDEDDERP